MRDRQGRHTFTRRIIIKRPNTTSCTWFASPSLASLDSRLGCSSEYTLGHGHQLTEGLAVFIDTTDFMGGIYIDDRPVPGFVFNYDLNTNIKANPIPSLCVDFIISLDRILSAGDRPYAESSEFSLQLPANSFITTGHLYFMGDLKPWRAFYVLYYKRSDKKLVLEHRFGMLTEAG